MKIVHLCLTLLAVGIFCASALPVPNDSSEHLDEDLLSATTVDGRALLPPENDPNLLDIAVRADSKGNAKSEVAWHRCTQITLTRHTYALSVTAPGTAYFQSSSSPDTYTMHACMHASHQAPPIRRCPFPHAPRSPQYVHHASAVDTIPCACMLRAHCMHVVCILTRLCVWMLHLVCTGVDAEA